MSDSRQIQDKLVRAASLYQSNRNKEADEIIRPILESAPDNMEAWRIVIQYADSKLLRTFYLSAALAKNPDHPVLLDLANQYQIQPQKTVVSTLTQLLQAPEEVAVPTLPRTMRPKLRATMPAAYLPALFGFILSFFLLIQSFSGFYVRQSGEILFPSIDLTLRQLFSFDLNWVNRWLLLIRGAITWEITVIQEQLGMGVLVLLAAGLTLYSLFVFLRAFSYLIQMRHGSKHIQGTIIGQWVRTDSNSRRYYLACAIFNHQEEIRFYQRVSRDEYFQYRAGDPVLVRHLNNNPKIVRMELDAEFQSDY